MMKETDHNWRPVLEGDLSEQSPQESQLLDYWLIDQLPIGVFQKDREGRYTFVNTWFCGLKKATTDQFVGKTADEVATSQWTNETALDPEKLREIKAYTDGADHHRLIMQTGQSFETAEHYAGEDGRERYIHVIKGPLFGPNGTMVGSQGILLDVTDRVQAEEQLASEGGMLRELMRSSTDCIYFKDRESRFRRCNAAMAPLFNLASPDEAIGKSDFDFYSKEQAEQFLQDEQEILRTGRPIIGKTEKQSWPDGRVAWMLTSKMPLYDEHGEIVGTFGISKDITDIKTTENRLEELNKKLLLTSRQAGMAEVATSVLHNVGNVLNSANVSTVLLLGNTRKSKVEFLGKAVALLNEHEGDLANYFANDPKGRQLPAYLSQVSGQLAREQQSTIAELESLRQNIEHIKEIVTMQQNYAKISGVAETVKATDLVEDAVRMNAGALVRHEVELVRDYSETQTLTTDKHKVLQVLVNLIRNAKYACDEANRTDKAVRIKVWQRGEWISIAVIDNGVGIPAENRTRIFNHGFTTRQDGHGFGLHSGALAATELGGTLTAHSDGPGKGATFTLELPLLPPKKSS